MSVRAMAGLGLVALAFFAGRFSRSGAPAQQNETIDPISFSELENAKVVIDGLARQYISSLHEFRTGYLQNPDGPTSNARRAKALESLLENRVEFKETSAEDDVTRELLMVLAGAKEDRKWLEVYFDFVFQNPTHSLVGDLTTQANAFAQSTGATNELQRVQEFLSLIPHRSNALVELASETSQSLASPSRTL